MNNKITNMLVFIGIFFIVTFFWFCLQMIINGEIISTKIDSIIESILTISLYYNYKNFINKEVKNGKDEN